MTHVLYRALAMRSGSVFVCVAIAACGHNNGPGTMNTIDAPVGGGSDGSGGGKMDAPMSSGNTYDTDGPITYQTMTETINANGQTVNATLYMPDSAGKHPLVAISCGTQQTAAGYATYAKRLASYGLAVIVEDDPGVLVNTSDVLPGAEYIITTWIPQMFADKIDLTKVGTTGHSRGGAVSLLTAEHLGPQGKVVAWFGIDPVDNEFGQNPREFARTKLGQLGMPSAFLGAEVVSNCAPSADSFETLYPLAPSPSVLIVGLGAGHIQFEPPDACSACNICSPNGTADSATVLAYATRYVTAFFARELLGDAGVGATFGGALGPADVAANKVTIMSK